MKIKKRTKERKEGFPIKDREGVKREKKQTQSYTGSAKSMPTSNTQATHLRFSTPFVKIHLQSLNHTGTTHPLCSGIITT